MDEAGAGMTARWRGVRGRLAVSLRSSQVVAVPVGAALLACTLLCAVG
jgi:hypothetical protein